MKSPSKALPLRHVLSALASVILATTGVAHAGGLDVTVLGARGGLDSGNLSAYLIRRSGSDSAVLCDAGSILPGLEIAEHHGAFQDIALPVGSSQTKVGYVLTHTIRAYLISHAHLDHIAGLVAVSPDDAPKPIYALPPTNAVLQKNIFNWQVWPNMGDAGPSPRLGQYHYTDLVPGQETPLPESGLTVTAFPLSHGTVTSTAFLVNDGQNAFLYLGDTGADPIEHSHDLHDLWRAVAPMVRDHRLLGMSIECSYDEARPDGQLFGHLSPRWLVRTLSDLDALAGEQATSRLTILVTHVKPRPGAGDAQEALILRQIRTLDAGRHSIVMARQGMTLHLHPS